jgi:hypothetical protein
LKNIKTVDDVILQYSTRGMDILQKIHPLEHCKEASENFLKLEKGVVFLYTGFYVNGVAETDGPLGTYFLAKVLKTLDFTPVIITDNLCLNYFKEIETIYIIKENENYKNYKKLLEDYNPICHISIERCGKNIDNRYINSSGVDISEFTLCLDDLFILGTKSRPSFAIGDGGNEIGMGNFENSIQEYLGLASCTVKCSFPILASVSNWGAYGFIAYLEKYYQKDLIPSFDEVSLYLEYIVSLGCVDGIKRENVKSVDGKDWEIEKIILNDLKKAISF